MIAVLQRAPFRLLGLDLGLVLALFALGQIGECALLGRRAMRSMLA